MKMFILLKHRHIKNAVWFDSGYTKKCWTNMIFPMFAGKLRQNTRRKTNLQAKEPVQSQSNSHPFSSLEL